MKSFENRFNQGHLVFCWRGYVGHRKRGFEPRLRFREEMRTIEIQSLSK
jgi:hypothetical protein